MSDATETLIYLIAPELAAMDAAALSRVLETGRVASLLLDVSTFVEGEAAKLEQMRDLAHGTECPLVVGGDDALAIDLAARFALDGVHLSGNPKQVGWARKTLGTNAIVGFDAGTSRHNAITAAEAGADYVAMGPLDALEEGLLSWWSKVIETPLVVPVTANDPALESVVGVADFILVDVFASGDDPVAALRVVLPD